MALAVAPWVVAPAVLQLAEGLKFKGGIPSNCLCNLLIHIIKFNRLEEISKFI